MNSGWGCLVVVSSHLRTFPVPGREVASNHVLQDSQPASANGLLARRYFVMALGFGRACHLVTLSRPSTLPPYMPWRNALLAEAAWQRALSSRVIKACPVAPWLGPLVPLFFKGQKRKSNSTEKSEAVRGTRRFLPQQPGRIVASGCTTTRRAEKDGKGPCPGGDNFKTSSSLR